MDIILQLYGTFFLLLGLLTLLWPKHEREHGFAKVLWLLGAFAVTRAFLVWMDMWREVSDTTPLLAATTPFVMLISSLFLFEFGRRLIRSSMGDEALTSMSGYLISPLIYVIVLGVIFYGSSLSDHGLRDLGILSQYFAGFTGSVLTGAGLIIYWHRRLRAIFPENERQRIELSFKALGCSFIAYGVLSGLVAAPAEWFPASRLNTEVFFNALHFPVQTASALCAALITIPMIYILRIFDIESRRRLETALADGARDNESLKRISRENKLLLWTAGDGIHILDMQGNVVEANYAFCQMLGYSHEEVLRMNVREWDAHFSAGELKERVPMLIGKRTVFETRHRRRDGKVFDVEISTVGVQLDDQTLLYCSSRDISDRKHAEEQLRLVSRVFDRAAEGVMITDEKQNILTVNDSFTTVTGYTREEAIGKTPAILHSGKQSHDFYKSMWESLQSYGWWQGEIWNRRKNGEMYLEWLSINAVRNEEGKVINYIGMFSDVTLIKESRQRVEFLATHDDLTNLPNRSLFNENLKVALARSARTDAHLALLFVDLDNFKMINDTLGHEEGDMLLKQVATRLKTCVREMDTVARLGGDEFVVLLEIDTREGASIMAKRILETFASSFLLDDQEYMVSPSIGISLFPEDASDPKTLMSHADTAMYSAKERGKNTYMFFTNEMAEHINRRMLIEHSLRQAIPNNELFLHYQPLINLDNDELVGVEALLRWRHQGEMIAPAAFIPIAEESGLIVDIECWVIGEVCRQMRAWDQAGLVPFWTSINISARHFRRPNLFSRIMGIAALAKISPRRLSIEITESSLMNVESASRMLQKLHEAGFRVSVDDFGTGFSSLSYLKRFPIHELKIDRSFIDGIATDPEDRSITTAIIAMARELGLKTVAEGVETEAQHEALKNLGCDIGQGYLYSKPMPAPIFQDWLLNRSGRKIAGSGR